MTGKFVKGSKVLAVSSVHAATTSPYCRYVGLQKNLLCAGSSYIKPRPATGIWWSKVVQKRRIKWPVLPYHHKQSLSCYWQRFRHPSVGVVSVFATTTNILKFKQYGEDYHSLCTRTTCKFVKCSKFVAISSDHAATPSPYCHYVGLQVDLLFPGSSYIKPTLAGGILCWSVIGEEVVNDASSVPPHAKSALLVTDFFSSWCSVMERCFYGTHILKVQQYRED